ncbi:AMP-binding protein, partial [Alcaligenes pakistanensis]
MDKEQVAGLPGTFPAWIEHHAQVRGDKIAMREKDLGIWQTWTWRELAEQVEQLAAGLAGLGVKDGQHVAVIGENRPRLYLAMMAAQMLGAVPVPLYQDAVAQEMLHVLLDASIRVAVVEDQEQVDKLLEVWDQCPDLDALIYDDPRGLRNYQQDQLQYIEQVMEQGRLQLARDPDCVRRIWKAIPPDQAAAMFYTSGTTGKPKGVVLTHGALVDRGLAIQELESLTDAEEVLAYLPPAWIGQNMFSYTQFLVTGFTVNHPESPETVSIDLHDIGPTYYFAPPRVLEGLLT